LWFTDPDLPNRLGPALGRGAVWLRDRVQAGEPSEPYLFAGYAHRSVFLVHDGDEAVTFRLEVDRRGSDQWETLRTVSVPPREGRWLAFKRSETGAWVRVKAQQDVAKASAVFHYRGKDPRRARAASLFGGLAEPGEPKCSGGLLHAGGGEAPRLRFLARDAQGELGAYELDAGLQLKRSQAPDLADWMRQNLAIPEGVLTADRASVVYTDEQGRWRLPRADGEVDPTGPLGQGRVCREVATERDLFNAYGTFYELPAENAGGFAKIRPITTHHRQIHDFASFRGLLVMSGIADAASAGGHVVRSEDGRCALWVGAVDDLWQFGKVRGVGGPWQDTAVEANAASDPYLMTGYDRKQLTLSHEASRTVGFRVEIDISGDGLWVPYRTFNIKAGQRLAHRFPDAFSAYWVRVVSDASCVATAQFTYD
jgi:hypothetical protein